MWTNCFSITFQGQVKPLSIDTHPTGLLGWHTSHEGKIRNIAIDYRPFPDKVILTYWNTTDNYALRAETSSFLDNDIKIVILSLDL